MYKSEKPNKWVNPKDFLNDREGENNSEVYNKLAVENNKSLDDKYNEKEIKNVSKSFDKLNIDSSKEHSINYLEDIDNFETFKKKKWNECIERNKKDFQKDINKKNPELIKKIKNKKDKFNLVRTVDNILNEAKNNEFIEALLMKDPTTQNFHENTQLEYQNKKGNNIKKLPGSGKKALYLSESELITNQSKKPDKGTKSLDFFNKDKRQYVYAKHTEEDGGSQDNQCKDCKIFIEEADKYCNKYPNKGEKFILLIDGKYYNDNRRKKLKSMISNNNKEKIIVCSSDTYPIS